MAERRRRHTISILVLVLVAIGSVWIVMRQGVIPARWSPLPRLSINDPLHFLIDWQIAELRNDRELCHSVLQGPNISATPLAPVAIKDGCGLPNGMRMSSAGGARLPADRISCEAAGALALWMTHAVQPLAQSMLGQKVTSVQHMGTYACRNIIGSEWLKGVKSQHATGNAIDISAFTLADGRTISVKQHWTAAGPESAFLKEIHARACRYFRISLSPEFNKAHHDHFHLDRGLFYRCV